MNPRACSAYYYGGLPSKGSRRKGRLRIENETLCLTLKADGKGEGLDLRVPVSNMDEIFETRDNYYGSDTVLLNLTFRDATGKTYTLRFAPVTIIPRRRIALQKEWFDYLARAISSSGRPSPLPTR